MRRSTEVTHSAVYSSVNVSKLNYSRGPLRHFVTGDGCLERVHVSPSWQHRYQVLRECGKVL